MRRYGDTTNTVIVPGQNVGLKLTMQPVVSAECQPVPEGLFWFTDDANTSGFTAIAEAAYLGAAESASPVLAVAKVLGETCGSVDWAVNWTPTSGTGGDPAIKTDGESLYVYQKTGSAPGELRVSAQCAGQTLGPIALTLLQSLGGGSCCPDPQIGAIRVRDWQATETTLLRTASINIGGTNLNENMLVMYSYAVSGTAPESIRFVLPGGAGLLTGTLLIIGGDETTSITVTATLEWDCSGVAQERTLTWPAFSVIEPPY